MSSPLPIPPALSRRSFITKAGFAIGGISSAKAALGLVGSVDRDSTAGASSPGPRSIESLKRGQTFNESAVFLDKITGRSTRRVTRHRHINMTPTYHLNDCFSADSKFMVLYTLGEDLGGAVLRADVATGEITVVEVAAKNEQEETGPSRATFVQATGSHALLINNSLRLYNLTTLEHKVILPDARGLSLTAASIDGKTLYATRNGTPRTVDGVTARPVTHLAISIATGETRELLTESVAQCSHVIACPTDPDLLLIDRDLPPLFNRGSDNGKTTRFWILNIKTGKVAEVRPNDPNRYAIHSNWSHDGAHVYYHGRCGTPHPTTPTGHYVGVADKTGKVLWEGQFPTFFYGHLATHTRADVIIADGLFTKNLITAIHWKERNSANIPKLEILAQHDTDWATGHHPHPHMSPDGRWLSYNKGEGVTKRCDVFVVQV